MRPKDTTRIRRIRVSNFRTFNETEIELGDFNVIVGPNASGKSNLIALFRFLKDITTMGLENAISMQGGVAYLRNLAIGSLRDLSIQLSLEARDILRISRDAYLSVSRYDYELSIRFYKRKLDYSGVSDKLTAVCEYGTRRPNGGDALRGEVRKGTITTINDGRRVTMEMSDSLSDTRIERFFYLSLARDMRYAARPRPRRLSIEDPVLLSPFYSSLAHYLRNISIYDFDPRLMKRATPVTGKTELEPDGSNLPLILKRILDNKRDRDLISSLVKDVLPLVEDFTVERLPDKSLLASIREIYSQKRFLPAFLISDGTVNVTTLVIALYFEKNPLVIIEEPERNIHPLLISKIVNMMKEVSSRMNKQVIITTHNPEVVKHAGIDNLLLVTRDEDGYSQVTRPRNDEEVMAFLENDLGVDDLFVQGILQ